MRGSTRSEAEPSPTLAKHLRATGWGERHASATASANASAVDGVRFEVLREGAWQPPRVEAFRFGGDDEPRLRDAIGYPLRIVVGDGADAEAVEGNEEDAADAPAAGGVARPVQKPKRRRNPVPTPAPITSECEA